MNIQIFFSFKFLLFFPDFRYLKDRNAQLERDRQERETREQLEEFLGFKDPKCPPGHMLMPPDELQQNISDMETSTFQICCHQQLIDRQYCLL